MMTPNVDIYQQRAVLNMTKEDVLLRILSCTSVPELPFKSVGEPRFQDHLLEDLKCLLYPGRLPEESLLIFFHQCLAKNKLENKFFKLQYLNEKE